MEIPSVALERLSVAVGMATIWWEFPRMSICDWPKFGSEHLRKARFPGATTTARRHFSQRLPARLARTRFKPSRLIRFPHFGQAKTAVFWQFSTPLDVDDTPERLGGKKRSETAAVLSRPQWQSALNQIVARRRSRAPFSTSANKLPREFFVEEVNAAKNRKFLRLVGNRGRSRSLRRRSRTISDTGERPETGVIRSSLL